MRVGFDMGPLTAKRTGVGNYAYFLLKHMLREGGAEFRGLATCRPRPALGGLEPQPPCRHIPIPTRAMYALWNAFNAPAADRLVGGADIYHATNYFLPPTRSARRVLTIHDLAFLVNPDWCSPRIVGPFSRNIARFAREADAVMVYSESTKRDIVRLLGADPASIHIAPMAVDEGFAPMDPEKARRLAAERYGIAAPFFLFVSTLEPRKNVAGLIEAFDRAAEKLPHRLVLVGGVGWNAEPILEAIAKAKARDCIVRPGYIPHEELPVLYGAADAFVFPTHYEGFGLPLLEALVCGCPVAASDSSSVPEVVGDAALLAPSGDIEAHAGHMVQLAEDAALRERLKERGFAQARRFSWTECARTTLGVYRRLAK